MYTLDDDAELTQHTGTQRGIPTSTSILPEGSNSIRLLCLWYYVGEGGLDLAEGTDRNPGVSYYSGILLCAVTTQSGKRPARGHER